MWDMARSPRTSAMARTAGSGPAWLPCSPWRACTSSGSTRPGTSSSTSTCGGPWRAFEPPDLRAISDRPGAHMTDLRLGVLLWNQAATWPDLLDAGKRVDELGYDHLWAWDHLYAIFGDPYQPFLEGW